EEERIRNSGNVRDRLQEKLCRNNRTGGCYGQHHSRRRTLRLACIAHKSLEICERCRLWQRNSQATPENSAALAGRKVSILARWAVEKSRLYPHRTEPTHQHALSGLSLAPVRNSSC